MVDFIVYWIVRRKQDGLLIVELAAVRDLDDGDFACRVVHLVADTVVADSYAPQVFFAFDLEAPAGRGSAASASIAGARRRIT